MNSFQMVGNRYLLHQRVRQGGFGTVYRAEDTLLQRPVALKEISVKKETWVVPYQTPLYEARALAALAHPHIPTVFDLVTNGRGAEKHYIVMEWIEGMPLLEYRAALGDLASPKARGRCLSLGEQLCKIVLFFHERPLPMILRDLKPANLLVTPGGKLYLVDLGAVQPFDPHIGKDQYPCGSPGYIAPEVLFHLAPSSVGSDLYSLGVTLAELFLNRHFVGEDAPVEVSCPQFPELERLLRKLVSRESWRRPLSAREALHTLQQLRAELPSHRPPRKKRRPAELYPGNVQDRALPVAQVP